MNAVNLIPAGRRARGSGPSLADSAPFIGLMLVLVLVLVGTLLYVGAHGRVTSRRAQLARVQQSTAKWQAAAAGFAPAESALKNRSSHIETARDLAGQRYDWSLLLGQLAGLMPKDTALTTLSASTSSAAAEAAGGSSTAPGISIAGCATNQDSVAAAMVALRRIVGVSEVALASSSSGGGPSSSSSSSPSSSGGSGCGSLPVTFQVSLTFSPPTEGAGLTSDNSSTSTTSSSGVAQ